jgi:hypothetical protein
MAQRTGFSKRSVPRLKQAMERRDVHPESWLWETEDGRRWLPRLVVATLSLCGLKRGVGLDTMSECLARLRLETQVGCSPSALRGVMQAMEKTIRETAQVWEQQATTTDEVREGIGAVDETFFEQMMLVFRDLKTGSLLLEEVAEDRTYTTWKGLVEERRQALRTHVLSVVSDRAKALIPLAEQGLECFSMPDVFHLMHAIVTGSSLALGRRRRQAPKEVKEAQAARARLEGRPQAAQEAPDAQTLVDMRQAEVRRWAEGHPTSRCLVETLSVTLHPFSIVDSAPQTSAQVESQLQTGREAREAFAQRYALPARPNALMQVRKQMPALGAFVDCWWQGVQQDLTPFLLSPAWRQWVHASLLPMAYWGHQVARTRCPRRQAKMHATGEAVRAAFTPHPLTQRLAPHVLADWHAWATERIKAFQRASSAVEGRNGSLSQMHHHHRGLPKRRHKVWTVLHNFDGRAADGTTPASRFFRRKFPDFFETVFSQVGDLPWPRNRNQTVALSG